MHDRNPLPEANMHSAVHSTIRLGMFAFFSTVASAIFVARLFYAIQEQQAKAALRGRS